MRLSVGLFATLLCSFLLTTMVGPREAQAHDYGFSLMSTSTPYLIDVGYPAPFVASDVSLFDFVLTSVETGELSEYQYVWVRIKQDKKTLLATGVAYQDLGPTTLLYSFPEAGSYVLNVSYRNDDDETLAEVAFPISVREPSDSGSFDFVNMLTMLAVALLGAAAGFLLTRRSRA